MILPHRASTEAPAYLLGSPMYPVFGPEPNFNTGRVLKGVLEPPIKML
jgi:hypothetical protein